MRGLEVDGGIDTVTAPLVVAAAAITLGASAAQTMCGRCKRQPRRTLRGSLPL
jgi:hypothetical protein